MNAQSIRRSWLKNRWWAEDIGAGIGFIFFCIGAYWALDKIAAAIQSAWY